MLVHFKNRKRRLWTSEDDGTAVELYRAGISPKRIGPMMGFSECSVRQHLVALGEIILVEHPNARKAATRSVVQKGKPNPLDMAYTFLNLSGVRLVERSGNFVLDGRVVGLNDVIRATNRLLKASDSPQLDANPAWIV